MKRFLIAALALSLFAALAAPAAAAKPALSGTISINEPGPYALDSALTFTTTVSGMSGSEWAMVYVQCVDANGNVLYGQLDYPTATFILGGGWSPWRDQPSTDAICHADLYVFNKQHVSTTVASTPAFAAAGA